MCRGINNLREVNVSDVKAKAPRGGKKLPEPPRAREAAKGKKKPKTGGMGRKFTARDIPHDPSLPVIKQKVGRPKDTPELWTPAYIAEVADLIRKYVAESDYPTEAEFCYVYDIRFQRLCEFPALREAKELIFAKRQAITIRRGTSLGVGEGALGSFLTKLAANAGDFSMTEKQEIAHSGGVRIFATDHDEKL